MRSLESIALILLATICIQHGHGQKPEIIFLKGINPINEGEILEMMCNSSHDSSYGIYWHANTTFDHQAVEREKNFIIPRVSRNDTGEYFCGRYNETDQKFIDVSDVVHLIVQYIDKPILKFLPGPEIEEGHSVKMKCIVHDSYPPVQYYDFVQSNKKIVLENTISTEHVIDYTTTNESGYYYCSAHTGKQQKLSEEVILTVTDNNGNLINQPEFWCNSFQFRLEILSAAEVDLSKERPLIGQSLTITCNVIALHANQSNNPVVYTWYKDGVKIQNNHGNFTIAAVASSSIGEYTCNAGIQRSRGFYSKTSRPKKLSVHLDVTLNSITEKEETPSQLRCQETTSIPNEETITYVWQKNGKNLPFRNSNIIPFNPIDFLRSVSGEYHCSINVSNKVVGSSNYAKVDVLYNDKPRINIIDTTKNGVRIIKFNCTIICNPKPIRIFYYKNGIEVASSGSNVVYVLNPFQEKDAGNYTCGIDNGVKFNGISIQTSEVIELKVSPIGPGKSSNTDAVMIGGVIAIVVILLIVVVIGYKLYKLKMKKTPPHVIEEPVYENPDLGALAEIPRTPQQNIYVNANRPPSQPIKRNSSIVATELTVELPPEKGATPQGAAAAERMGVAESKLNNIDYDWIKFEDENPYDKTTLESEI